MSESAIFKSAVKLTPDQRAAYLDHACGADSVMRGEIEALLRAHDDSSGFLAGAERTIEQSQIAERPGTVIGPYKLMEQIGEGGMGLVFVAEQQQPVRRKVALKIIKPGMDTRDVIARFEAERQALALMDHPNIAKVLDAGATDSGRPYFVMELVKGVPITDYCDQYELTPRERLELFVGVCHAVQHAHTKGVIHRDLKPSNVLIAPHDGKPVVKVIDFGVAKAVGSALTDKTIYTGISQMIGTPLYMSPEQAEINALDVDTRSDVYGLGVLLYELLTGTTPFDRERLHTAAFDEIRRIIREEEPPRPSTRLTTLGPSLSAMSAKRKTEPGKLSSLFKGDLDWIVMKALEKDRTRRYETASAFAADIRRFLSEEPIEARPPSALYRFRKMARRNKAAMVTTALVAAALVLGIVGTTLGLLRALDAETDAVTARDQTEDQRKLAVAAAADATKSESRAKAEEENARLLAKKEKTARQQAEEQEQAAKDLALRAEIWQHATQISLAFQAWSQHDVYQAERILDEVQDAFQETWEQRHLRDLCRRRVLRMTGHTAAVTSVAMSADGLWVASGSQDKTVKLWDVRAGFEKFTMLGHMDIVRGVAMTPDGKTIVSGGNDRRVRVWDATTGKETAVLKGHHAPVRSVVISADGKRIVSGSVDQTVKLWDTQTGEAIRTFTGHTDEVACVALSADGTFIASGSNDKTVRVWELANGKLKFALTSEGDYAVSSVAICPDCQRIAGGVGPRDVTIWNAATGQPQLILERGKGSNACVAFTADGKRIVKGGTASFSKGVDTSSTLEVLDAATGQQILALKDRSSFQAIALNQDGTQIALGSGDLSVKVWSVNAVQPTLTLKGHQRIVGGLAISADGQHIVSGGPVGKGASNLLLSVWDLSTSKETLTLEGFTAARMSADGSRVLAADFGAPEKALKVLDRATGQDKFVLDVNGRNLLQSSVNMSDDGNLIAVYVGPGKIRLWDGISGKEKRTLEFAGPSQLTPLRYLAFSAKGRRIAAGFEKLSGKGLGVKVLNAVTGEELLPIDGRPNEIRILDTETGQQVALFGVPSDGINCMVFSADGQRIIIGSDNRTIVVCAAESGRILHTLRGHTAKVNDVAISMDGTRIVSGDADGALKVWDARTGQETLTIKAHTGGTKRVVINARGDRIVSSGGNDGLVRVWDAPKLSVKKEEKGAKSSSIQHPANETGPTWLHDSVVHFAAFTPDGKSVVSADDSKLRVWANSSGKELNWITLPTTGGKSAKVRTEMSKDGTTVAIFVSSSGTIHFYDIASGKELRQVTLDRGMEQLLSTIAFSPDGKYLASRHLSKDVDALLEGTVRQNIRIWDLASGKNIQSFDLSPQVERLTSIIGPTKTALAYMPDGKMIASVRAGYVSEKKLDIMEINFWDPATGTLIRTIQGSGILNVTSTPLPVFTPDGKKVAFAIGEHVTVVEVATGTEIKKLPKKGALPTALAFSNDGTKLYTGLKWGRVLEWGIASGTVLREFDDAAATKNIVVSPDGNTLMLYGVGPRLEFVDLRSANKE